MASGEVKATLIYAQALVVDPGNFLKGTEGKDRNGNNVKGSDRSAVKFCASGAIEKALVMRRSQAFRNGVYEALADAIPLQSDRDFFAPYGRNKVIAFNDNAYTSHENVLAAFDRAIQG